MQPRPLGLDPFTLFRGKKRLTSRDRRDIAWRPRVAPPVGAQEALGLFDRLGGRLPVDPRVVADVEQVGTEGAATLSRDGGLTRFRSARSLLINALRAVSQAGGSAPGQSAAANSSRVTGRCRWQTR